MSQYSLWGESSSQSRDRWSHPCSNCSGTGNVLRQERVPCGCVYRCNGCDGKSMQPVTKECSSCGGSGVGS